MKSIVEAVGIYGAALIGSVLAIVVVVALSWAGYLLYLHYVEGAAITQHAVNVRHGLNFVQSANQRAENAIAEYTADSASGDTSHAEADRIAACSAASSITESEMQRDVYAFVSAHCGEVQ